MKKSRLLGVVSACLLVNVTLSGSAVATTVVGAETVSSPQGGLPGSPLVNIINQSGLSVGYTSGVTDFASYTGSTTHTQDGDGGFTNLSDNGPQQFSFDLGSVMTIDALAIWNTWSLGAITSFELFVDNDGIYGNGTGDNVLVPTPGDLATSSSDAQVFEFAAVSTRYIHLNALSSLDPPDFYGLNEVVFSAVVPVPAAVWLFGSGLLGLLGVARRKKAA